MKFKFVCRIYFETAKSRNEIDPAFSDCPTECPNDVKYFDASRFKFCETCPRKKNKDDFKSKVVSLISELFGEKEANNFNFSRFEQTLYSVMSFQDMRPHQISVKTNALLSGYLSEKHRFERIQDLEKGNGK